MSKSFRDIRSVTNAMRPSAKPFDITRKMAQLSLQGKENSAQNSGSMDPSKDTKLSEVVGQYNEARIDAKIKIHFKRIKHPRYTDYQKAKKQYYKYFSMARGMQTQKYLELLDKHSRSFIPKDSKVCMRIDAGVLRDIIEKSDHFKSLHLTNTSNALPDVKMRLDDENARIGNYSPNMPGEFRPIYGYIATREHPLGSPGKEYHLDRYGDVAVVFKDRVKQRTSFLVGDSADANVVLAVPLENPNGDCFPLDKPLKPTDSIESLKERDPLKKGFGDWTPYVEAQIHYGASLQDVEYVVLRSNAADGNDLIALLQKANIPTYLEKV